jgi:hypothetical protein
MLPNTPPSLSDTPKILSIAIDDVILAFERGSFEQEVLRRRHRAAVAPKPD